MSSTGGGSFQASLAAAGDAIAYKLSYADLEGDITQSHIHFGQRGVNGAIVTFLCSNLGNGPAGTQACPPAPATIEGVIAADDIVASAAAQGIAAGEFAEVLRAIRSGITYANVHTTKHAGVGNTPPLPAITSPPRPSASPSARRSRCAARRPTPKAGRCPRRR